VFDRTPSPLPSQNLKALSVSITKLAEVANKTVLTQKQEQLQSPTPPEPRGVSAGDMDRKQQQAKKAALKEKAEALRKEVRAGRGEGGEGRGEKRWGEGREEVRAGRVEGGRGEGSEGSWGGRWQGR
jgi:hypothetical protein